MIPWVKFYDASYLASIFAHAAVIQRRMEHVFSSIPYIASAEDV